MSDELTLADVIRQPAPGLDHPGSPSFSPDASAVTYLQSADHSLVRSLWWHDLASGARAELLGSAGTPTDEEALTHEERLRRERTRTSELGVTEHAWSTGAGSATLLVPRSGTALTAHGGAPPELAPVPGVEGTSCTILSPDGRRLAFVRDGDLWVVDLPDGTPRRLTHDAQPGVRNGLAEYAAAEELDRYDGIWWAADSSAIACAHVDERGVPPFVIAHLASDQPASETHRYPFSGGANAVVSLRVIDVSSGRTVDAALPKEADDYLARVVPRPDGGMARGGAAAIATLVALVLARGRWQRPRGLGGGRGAVDQPRHGHPRAQRRSHFAQHGGDRLPPPRAAGTRRVAGAAADRRASGW